MKLLLMTLQTILIRLFIGITIILVVLWTRIFRFFIEPTQISFLLSFIPILMIMLFSILILINIAIIFKSSLEKIFTNKKKFLFKPIIILYKKYIFDASKDVYLKIIENINLKPLIELPASYFVIFNKNYKKYVNFLIFFPQILVSFVFFTELCLTSTLYIFYKVLPLLIVFLIARITFFCFRIYSERFVLYFEKFLDIDKSTIPVEISLKDPEKMPLDEYNVTFESVIIKYDFMCESWFINNTIYTYMCNMLQYELKYNLYVNVIIYFMYLVGWILIFFK